MPKENEIVRPVIALISTHIGTRYRQVLKGKYPYLCSVLKNVVSVHPYDACTQDYDKSSKQRHIQNDEDTSC